MGCDSRLFLPPTTKQGDFLDVFAAMLGSPMVRGVSGDAYWYPAYWYHADGLKARTTHTTTMNMIEGVVCGHQVYSYWHWCAGSDYGFPGWHVISCGMGTHRFALLDALADFFGGAVDYDDCDSIDVNHLAHSNNLPYRPDATDGDAWNALQDAKSRVRPVPLRRLWHDFDRHDG